MGEESAAAKARPGSELRHDLRTPLNHIIGYGEMLIEEARYNTERVQLQSGDGIFLYTDGVTEAEDAAGNQFEDDRVEQLLQDAKGQPVEAIIRETFRQVFEFANGAPQDDDITAMALRYEGR